MRQRARPDLWEPGAGNRPGPPGHFRSNCPHPQTWWAFEEGQSLAVPRVMPYTFA